jgi:hypothetical protein
LKIRSMLVAAVAVVSSFALLAPAAHASGSACYSVHIQVNDQVVDQAGCQELP